MILQTPEKQFRIRVGRRIRILRARLDMTQLDLAYATGLCRATINHIEAGKSDSALSTFHRIANGLGVPMEELFEGLYDDKRR